MLHVGGCTWGKREVGKSREGRREPGAACIRYLSRRCCVQVNKLTRRRASAIFFPINLNLLLTLFPYPTYPKRAPRLRLSPFTSPLAHDSPFSAAISFSLSPSFSSPLCLYQHRRVPSLFYSFLISLAVSPSLRFPSLFSLTVAALSTR